MLQFIPCAKCFVPEQTAPEEEHKRKLTLLALIFKTKPTSSGAFDIALLVLSEKHKKPWRALFWVNRLSAIFLFQTQQGLFVPPLTVSILLYQNQYLFVTEQCHNAWVVAFLVIRCNCACLSGRLEAVPLFLQHADVASSTVLWYVICNCWCLRGHFAQKCAKSNLYVTQISLTQGQSSKWPMTFTHSAPALLRHWDSFDFSRSGFETSVLR